MKNLIRSIGMMSLTFAITIYSCHKEVNSATGSDRLATIYGTAIRINQAIIIYDTTIYKNGSDSSSLFYTDHFYKWVISPADDSAVFSQNYRRGYAEIIFDHSGNYQVSAMIYDSLGQRLIGHTDTMAVTVTADTLYQFVAIQPDDELLLTKVSTNYPNAEFSLSTLKSYDLGSRYEFGVAVSDCDTSVTFAFADSVTLADYPFGPNADNNSPVGNVTAGFGLFQPEAPKTLNIIWLNKTYTGTIIYNSAGQLVYTWDNAGAVKFTN